MRNNFLAAMPVLCYDVYKQKSENMYLQLVSTAVSLAIPSHQFL